MKKATAIEILAFVSLHIYKGLYKLNAFRITRLFSERYGLPIFSAIMFRKRFSFHSCKPFVWQQRNLYTDQWKQDRSAAARELLEMAKGMWLPMHGWKPIPYMQSSFIQTAQSMQASKIRIAVQVNQCCNIPLHIYNTTRRQKTTKWRWPILSSRYRECCKVPHWLHG